MQILPVWFIYVAAGMRIFGGLAYVRATLEKRARPHAVSWIIWATTPLITFIAGLSSIGFKPGSVITLALGISPILVVLAALKTDRRLFRIDSFDATCLTIAGLGIIFWMLSQNPLIAIVMAISADAVSTLPTIRKTIRKPKSEYPLTYFISASSMLIALLATTEVAFETFAFPVYALIMNTVIVGLALRAHRKAKRKTKKR